MTENEKLQLSLVLEGDLKQKFQDIQKRLGVNSKSDVMRFLIKQYKMKDNEN